MTIGNIRVVIKAKLCTAVLIKNAVMTTTIKGL